MRKPAQPHVPLDPERAARLEEARSMPLPDGVHVVVTKAEPSTGRLILRALWMLIKIGALLWFGWAALVVAIIIFN